VTEERLSCRFSRKERLKRRKEIWQVFRRGRRFNCSGAKLFVLNNGLSCNRICFTFTRKFGNAVERNRAKRLGREAYRMLKSGLKGGFDLVLQVSPVRAAQVSCVSKIAYVDRLHQLTSLFTRAGLLMDR
jgi:ribonuclease P protein component